MNEDERERWGEDGRKFEQSPEIICCLFAKFTTDMVFAFITIWEQNIYFHQKTIWIFAKEKMYHHMMRVWVMKNDSQVLKVGGRDIFEEFYQVTRVIIGLCLDIDNIQNDLARDKLKRNYENCWNLKEQRSWIDVTSPKCFLYFTTSLSSFISLRFLLLACVFLHFCLFSLSFTLIVA